MDTTDHSLTVHPPVTVDDALRIVDPVNRKALRTFNSLFRRKKLKHLAVTGLFTFSFVQFCALNLPEHW